MKQRPLSITLIALFYLFEPIGNLGFAAYANGIPVLGQGGVVSHLLWSDWLILLLFPVTALGIYMVKPWGWYLFMGFSALLVGYNLIVHFYLNPIYEFWTVMAFILIITAVAAVFFRRHIYSPYFNPRLRWWEVPTRYRVTLDTRISTQDHGVVEAQILDISASGCFIEYTGTLTVGENIWLRIRCVGTEINCLGRVVRQSAAHGGYGLLFQAMTAETRQRLQGLIVTLRRLGGQDRSDRIPAASIPEDFHSRRVTMRQRFTQWLGSPA